MNPKHPTAEHIRHLVNGWLHAGGDFHKALFRRAAAEARLRRFRGTNPHTGLPASGPRRPAGTKIARRAHQQRCAK